MSTVVATRTRKQLQFNTTEPLLRSHKEHTGGQGGEGGMGRGLSDLGTKATTESNPISTENPESV